MSLSTICSQSRLLAEDVNLDGTPDLVASCGDVITILLASDSGGLDLTLVSPPLGSPVVDLALASLDHGRARDVHATTVDQSLWWLDSDTGELENTRIRATGVEHIDGGSHIVNFTIYSNTAAPFNFANFSFHLHRPTRQRTAPSTTSGKATPHTPYAGYFYNMQKNQRFPTKWDGGSRYALAHPPCCSSSPSETPPRCWTRPYTSARRSNRAKGNLTHTSWETLRFVTIYDNLWNDNVLFNTYFSSFSETPTTVGPPPSTSPPPGRSREGGWGTRGTFTSWERGTRWRYTSE